MSLAVPTRRRRVRTPLARPDRSPGVTRAAWRGAASSLGLQSLGIALGMGLQLLLARALGVAAFGQFAYAVSLLGALHVLAKLGLDSASWRFIAEYRATQRWALLAGFVRASRGAALAASAVIGSASAASIAMAAPWIGGSLAAVLGVACLTLPAYVFNQLQVAQLVAWRRPAAGYAPPLLLRPLLAAAGVGALFAWRGWQRGAVTAAEAMWINFAALGTIVAVSQALWSAVTPGLVRRGPRQFDWRKWTATTAPMWGTSCLGLVAENLDVLLVGAFRGTTEAGIYAMASRLARLLNLGLMSASAATIPLSAELLASGRREELQGVVRHAAAGLAAFAMPTALILVLCGRWLLSCLGPEFAAGYPVLALLAAGQLVNSLTGSCGQLLNAGGHQGIVFRLNVAASTAHALLLLTLTPTLGMIGAALAGCLTLAAWNLILAREARRRLRVESTLMALWRTP